MKLNQKEIFVLNATLRTSYGNVVRVNQFDRIYCVKKIREIAKSNTFYDSDLKMHFQKDDLQESVYELELYKNYLQLENKLKKAQEFIRRVGYWNDWMQVRMNLRGKILAVENKLELMSRWEKIKRSLLKEYEGQIVTNYLAKMDKKLNSKDSLFPSLHQYYLFGLLFPPIPVAHRQEWKTMRQIELSEYENQMFGENITFIGSDDNMRQYHITGNALEDDSTFTVEGWEGNYLIASNEVSPTAANVEIVIKNGSYSNHWSFKLEKH